ncbi:PIG-L family deacetylase [Allobranchiibius sp. CTAmp26]|uniref:PIG-L family deacetylase n=1 Tax=Allobranchiibius sp. CTAmp26 TaxID=2815214 RepID=UPI001AA119B5|nr:PIG-L family deacetylase [Allobranchiibius sp. CTAmp26]MBO1756312.1 PIG-L family deacetylase [Allobranchiibius sp. CTAmp26]
MARLLFVHAHPDDETLANGIAIAHHVRAGDEVHVLTATLGEEGEVIPAELAHLELPAGQLRPDDVADPLADVRRAELACAMKTLGVTSSQLLPGGWRDSGMAGSPASRHPRAFAAAPVEVVGAAVAGVVRELAPDVVVTYDRHGGYGHPDHIQVHRAVVSAVGSLPAQARPRLFATLIPRSWAQEDRSWLQAHVPSDSEVQVPGDGAAYAPSVVPDEQVTHEVLDPSVAGVQADALRCHRTQVSVHDGFYALSNAIAARLSGREGFAEIDSATGELIALQGSSRRGLLG